MLTLEPLTCQDLPRSIEADWRRLCAVSEPPTINLEFELNAAWTRFLKGRWTPLILLAKDGSRLRGIVPLMYRDERRRGIMPYRRIRFLASTHTDFSGIIASPEDARNVASAAFGWLTSGDFRWELMVLDDLMGGLAATASLMEAVGMSGLEYTIHHGKYFHIDLRRSWDEIIGETSKSYVRRYVTQSRNRMKRAGAWSFVVNPEWSLDRILDESASLHIKRQGELGRESFFADQPSRRFIRCLLEFEQIRGGFNSYWLFLDERPIAYLFGFVQDAVFYFWNFAYDPAFEALFPSRLLLHEVLRDCFERGMREFNFMRGESAYKSKWTPHFHVNYRLTIKNTKSLYGRALALLDRRLSPTGAAASV